MADGIVAITILTYNSAEHVLACIRSVKAQKGATVHPTVVDNASSDGTADLVARAFPDVPLVRHPANLGFAKAHNLAIAQARGDYYMPLNPDCRLAPDYVARLVQAIEQTPEAGYAAGKIVLDHDGPTRLYSAGHFQRADGTVLNRGHGERDRGQYDRPEVIWGANGAAVLYSMRMLDRLRIAPAQFIDEIFFMYGEDVDMDWRAHRAGFACAYEPAALAHHVGGASHGLTSARVRRQYFRNGHLVKIKNAPTGDFCRRMLLPMLADYGRYALGDPLGAAVCAAQTLALLPTMILRRRTLRSQGSREERIAFTTVPKV